jgi:hypothetical protein
MIVYVLSYMKCLFLSFVATSIFRINSSVQKGITEDVEKLIDVFKFIFDSLNLSVENSSIILIESTFNPEAKIEKLLPLI